MKKLRILALLLVLCMALSGLAVAASAQKQATSGVWENITWNFNTQTKELRISGEGAMPSKWPIYFPWRGLGFESVVIEEGITSVSRQAFELKSNLTKVSLPESLESIDMDAFLQADITEIYIPAGVTKIDSSAFASCENLKKYVVDPANTAYCSDQHGVLFTKDMTELRDMPDAFQGDYTIPDSVTYIYRLAFEYCDYLTSIHFPAGADIPYDDLDQIPNLKKITVDPDNPDYSNDAKGVLFNKDKTVLLKIPSGYEGHYDIPESVVTFGELSNPTACCNKLTSISIPASTTNIAYYWDYDIFPGSNLEKIIVHKNNQNYCDDQGVLYDKNMTTLYRIPEGFKGSYTIPETVTNIKYYGALGCTALTEVTVLGSLEKIGSMAFEDCDKLKEIRFCGDAPVFGYDCFYNLAVTVCYPAKNATWTEAVMSDDNHGGEVTWKADPCLPSHTEVVDKGSAATCTKSGLTDGKHCSFCDKVTVEQKTIAPTGHKYGNWTEIKAATVEETGLAERTCTVCGNIEQKTMDKLRPADPDPIDPHPTEPTPTNPELTEPDVTVPAPTEPVPTEPAQTNPAETEPVETIPTPTVPVQIPDSDDGNVTTVVVAIVVVVVLGGGGAAAFVLIKKFRI